MALLNDRYEDAPDGINSVPCLEEPKPQSLLFHGLRQVINPFRHSWTLIKLGYEPLKPIHFYTPSAVLGWSPPILIYPNILKYTYHTMKTFGVWNTMSAGFFANVCMDFTSAVFYGALCRRSQKWSVWRRTPSSSGWYLSRPAGDEAKFLPSTDSAYAVERQMEEATWSQFLNMLLDVLSLRAWEVIITHPFYVVMVRQIGALVCGDLQYAWFPVALRSIHRETGFWGFFQGLAPRLVGEVLSLAVYYSACRLITRIFFASDQRRPAVSTRLSPVKDLSRFALYLFVRHHAYPFELTALIMMTKGAGLQCSREADSFASWYTCYRFLLLSGQVNRGRWPIIRSHIQTSPSLLPDSSS